MRILQLSHKQIELLQHALGIAEREFTKLHKQNIETFNTRNNVREHEQREGVNHLHDYACLFADLNNDIKNSKLDV